MSVVLLGSTSGSITLQEPAVAGTTVLDLPAVSGTILTTTSPKAGNVIQVVNNQSSSAVSTSSTIPLDGTIPQNTEGAELFTLAITPTSSSSKLLIQVVVQLYPQSTAWGTIALFQDSTANAIASSVAYMTTATGGMIMPLNYYMTAGTTSSTTFKVRYGASTGNCNVNTSAAGLVGSSITIMEIAV
jgi:hypothetical protein